MELKLTQRFQLQPPEPTFEISPSIAPEEMARRVRLAFKQMPEESALVVFARVMTSDVPHDMKVAVWDAVRYSHIWWHVDDVLKGDVMENPIVQCAFADAVAMRCWRVQNQMPDWPTTRWVTKESASALSRGESRPFTTVEMWLWPFLNCCVEANDDFACEQLHILMEKYATERFDESVIQFCDFNGNNALWYLTYRDDQQSEGGFACPKTAKALIDLGVDPNHRNRLGLCWNDVARHVNRPG